MYLVFICFVLKLLMKRKYCTWPESLQCVFSHSWTRLVLLFLFVYYFVISAVFLIWVLKHMALTLMHLLVDAIEADIPKRLRLLLRLFLGFQTSDRVKIARGLKSCARSESPLGFLEFISSSKTGGWCFPKNIWKKVRNSIWFKTYFLLDFSSGSSRF